MYKTQIDKINNSYEIAEKAAYSFTKNTETFKAILKDLNEHKAMVDGISPFWIIMSFVGIPLGIVFAIYEANMAQQAILTLLDPLGLGNVNKTMVSVIGAGLAVFAMFLGHIFSEGLYHNKTTDRLEGKAPLYFSIVGLLGYVGFQYYLVQAAGEGGEQFTSFAMIAIGVAILEILVGILILGKSLTYMVIFFNSIRIWLLIKAISNKAYKTSKYYRDYRSKLHLWNKENIHSPIELEGNENIRQAIAHYSGTTLENNKPNVQQNRIKIPFNEGLN